MINANEDKKTVHRIFLYLDYCEDEGSVCSETVNFVRADSEQTKLGTARGQGPTVRLVEGY